MFDGHVGEMRDKMDIIVLVIISALIIAFMAVVLNIFPFPLMALVLMVLFFLLYLFIKIRRNY